MLPTEDWTKVLYPLYTVTFVTGIPGYILLIVVIFLNRKLQTTTNILLTNQALASLVFFFDYVMRMTTYIAESKWVLGEFICRVGPLVTSTALFVVSTSFAVIACARLFSLLFPNSKSLPKLTILAIAICAQWVAGVGLSVPLAVRRRLEHITLPNIDISGKFTMEEKSICYIEFPTKDKTVLYYSLQALFCFGLPALVTIVGGFLNTLIQFLSYNRRPTEAEEQEELRKRKLTNILLLEMSTTFFAVALSYGVFSIKVSVNSKIEDAWNLQITDALIGCILGLNPWIYMLVDTECRNKLRMMFACKGQADTNQHATK